MNGHTPELKRHMLRYEMLPAITKYFSISEYCSFQ